VTEVQQEVVWSGSDALRQFLVPIDTLKDHPDNPVRAHEGEILLSLNRFGQTRAILIDGDTIVGGHHVRKAARLAGWTHIAAIPNEFQTREEMLVYLIADNNLARMEDLSPSDQLRLAELAGETNLVGTGMTIDTVEDLRAQLSLIAETDSPVEDRGYTEDEEAAAARAENLRASKPMRETVFMLTQDEADSYSIWLKALQAAYKTAATPNPSAKFVMLTALESAYLQNCPPDGEATQGPTPQTGVSQGDPGDEDSHGAEEAA
jgi:hypothetical protein